MEYYSAIEKNEIMPSAAICMDLGILSLNEVSQKVRQTSHDTTCMWRAKCDTEEHVYERGKDSQTQNRLAGPQGRVAGRDGRGG